MKFIHKYAGNMTLCETKKAFTSELKTGQVLWGLTRKGLHSPIKVRDNGEIYLDIPCCNILLPQKNVVLNYPEEQTEKIKQIISTQPPVKRSKPFKWSGKVWSGPDPNSDDYR